MKTELISATNPTALSRAVAMLEMGGLVAFPTDTVYGLGANMLDRRAINRIYEVKERNRDNPIPILVASIEELHSVAEHVSSIALKLAERFWPGPLTLVIQRRPELPDEISPSDMIGVRMPDHELSLKLLGMVGPLAVSSANRSGESPARTASEVFESLGGKIELILDGGTTPGGVPSTVVDCTKKGPTILRTGPISEAQILQILKQA
jgi:L-threonylcarbamoyladenylate synthase